MNAFSIVTKLRGLTLGLSVLLLSLLTAAVSANQRKIAEDITPRAGVVGNGAEILMNVSDPNGNVYDYVLMTGATVQVTADAGQITRVYFIDPDDDLLSVDFSGAGTLSITLENPSGPAQPLKYNQEVNYMKGRAFLTIQGANATTNLSIFSVGRVTAVNQGLFRDDAVYDGVADIGRLSIIDISGDGQFGGLRTANVHYSAAEGITGISATGVAFTGPVMVGDITATGTAVPVLQFGSASTVQIVGGSLFQPNGRSLMMSGVTELLFTSGITSHGVNLPAHDSEAQSQVPAIVSGNSANFIYGEAGSFAVTARGFLAPTFSVAGGTFPAWAILHANTGIISGTPPDAVGSPFTFTLRAGNGVGGVADQSFTLTVIRALTVEPLQNRTVTAGDSVTWTASTTGEGTLAYQWRRDGQPIAGATSPSFSIQTVTMFDAGRYDVVVSEGGNQVISASGVLDVAPTRYPGIMRVDPEFATLIESAGGTVNTIVRQSDGKFIVGGSFSGINGVSRRNFARLHADGSVDVSFNPGSGPDGVVSKVILQPDGKVLLAGYFITYNGVSRGHLARVNIDGSLDLTFNSATGADDDVTALALQGDGKVLIGGWFSTVNGVSRGGVARVNPDGSLDATFDPGLGASSAVNDFALLPDGKVMAVGFFVTFNGALRQGVARLLPNGGLDSTFVPATGEYYDAWTLALQTDGKILVGADGFSSPVPNLLRLNSDGSRDGTFTPMTLRGVRAIAVQSDGAIVIGGAFGTYNGAPRNHIARLTASGALDSTFDAGAKPDFHVNALLLQPDGKPVLGGRFLLVEESLHSAIARLSTTGALDDSFAGDVRSPGQVDALIRQPDGKLLFGGGAITSTARAASGSPG